jgi:hypothetical protein
MIAVWVLAAAIVFLAVAILGAAWVAYNTTSPGLSEDECRDFVAPIVAAELIVMAAQADDEPVE